jgi:hypothetical protein
VARCGMRDNLTTVAKKFSKEWFAEQGSKGGKKSRRNLTADQRSESARRAVQARWAKNKDKP